MLKRYLICLYIIRFFLICIPQSGYIHPDEFFQSLEVTVGDVFNVDHLRTWEFNASATPLRSPTAFFPMITFPLYIYKLFCQASVCSPTIILIITRLWSSVVSLCSVDLLIYCACQKMQKLSGIQLNHLALTLYGLSSIALVFSSRTLSNVWELNHVCMLSLLCFQSPSEMLYSLIGALFAWATFCRPTFSIFATPVFLLHLFNIFFIKQISFKKLFFSLGFLLFSFIFVSCFIAVLDAVYYQSHSTFIFTPINFLFYNLDSKSLSSHGHHPFYTHFLVNLPQLFTPLIWLAILWALSLLVRSAAAFKKYKMSLTKANPLVVSVATCLWLIIPPVCMLSLFCHQEVRFLLPLTPWAVILTTLFLTHATPRNRNFLFLFYSLFHLLSFFFWGFLHQGGLVRLLLSHSSLIQSTYTFPSSVMLFYHTYMPPRFLIMQKQLSISNNFISVMDLGGAEFDKLLQTVNNIISKAQNNTVVHVIYPTSLHHKLTFPNSMKIIQSLQIFGHLSMEDPPDLNSLLSAVSVSQFMSQLSLTCSSFVFKN